MKERNLDIKESVFANHEAMHPRIHARLVDKSLGFRTSKIEEKLLKKFSAYDKYVEVSNRKQHYEGTETWIGLHPQVLQTPYSEIYQALLCLKEKEINHIVDIGAGYGRVGLVLSVLRPQARFTGYEILKSRQREGNRVFKKYGAEGAEIILQDVLDSNFEIPQADLFFIYDFSDREDVNQILRKLSQKVARTNKENFLVTVGERIDYLMKNKFSHSWELYKKLITSDLKIYKSINAIKE